MKIRKANGKSEIEINGRLLARAITAKEFSIREVARIGGTTFQVIYRMTKNNRISTELPTRTLADIASALDISLSDLLDPTLLPGEQPFLKAPEPPANSLDDAQRLSHLLVLRRSPTSPETLAKALGWRLPRLALARDNLNAILEPLGVEARHENAAYYLSTLGPGSRRNAMDDVTRVNLIESICAPMKTPVAQIMHDAMNGITRKNYPRALLPHRANAVNVGYLVPGEQGETDFVPSAAFLYAFPD